MTPTPTRDPDVRTRLLDAAERLFYAGGVQAVGVDAVVAEAGVATRTLYTAFGNKDGLVEAYLRRRDRRWMNWLRGAVEAAPPGRARVPAVFDALGRWFAEPDFNGCAFINVAGEIGAGPAAAAIAREHKVALRALLAEVAAHAVPAGPGADGGQAARELADWLMLLVEGAIVTAHVEGDTLAAGRAAAAAAALLHPAPPERERVRTRLTRQPAERDRAPTESGR